MKKLDWKKNDGNKVEEEDGELVLNSGTFEYTAYVSEEEDYLYDGELVWRTSGTGDGKIILQITGTSMHFVKEIIQLAFENCVDSMLKDVVSLSKTSKEEEEFDKKQRAFFEPPI